jgi:outer membrane protein TolC
MMNRRRVILVLVGVLAGSNAWSQVNGPNQPPAQSFTLAQALQYAVDHYPSVRAALEQMNVSSATVSVARAAYLPRLDTIWHTNRATANNIFGQLLPQSVIPAVSGPVLPSASAGSVWGTAVGALVSWEPFDFGVRSAVVHEAEAGVVRSRAEESLTRLGVEQAVGHAFLAVVSAQQAVAAADADVRRRGTLAQAAQALADNQLRPGAEASRALAERAAADTRVIQARQALAIAEARLAQCLGIADRSVTASTAGLLDRLADGAGPPTPAQGHPLLQSGQAAVDLASARESVLAATYRPRVYLQSSVSARGTGANVGGDFNGGADGLGLERANWAAGVQVVFPNLFDVASARARQAAAGAATRAERARYDEAALMVGTEQRTADAVVAASRAIAQNTPVQLSAARLSEMQARARYDAGLTSIVDVADAQHLLAQAEYQDAAARVDVWRALLAQAAAGGSLAPFVERLRVSGVR